MTTRWPSCSPSSIATSPSCSSPTRTSRRVYCAFAVVGENVVLAALEEDRFRGHLHAQSLPSLDFAGDEHLGLQPPVRVVERRAHFERARRRIEKIGDARDLCSEIHVAEDRRAYVHRLADREMRQIFFGGVEDHPQVVGFVMTKSGGALDVIWSGRSS